MAEASYHHTDSLITQGCLFLPSAIGRCWLCLLCLPLYILQVQPCLHHLSQVPPNYLYFSVFVSALPATHLSFRSFITFVAVCSRPLDYHPWRKRRWLKEGKSRIWQSSTPHMHLIIMYLEINKTEVLWKVCYEQLLLLTKIVVKYWGTRHLKSANNKTSI